MKGLVLYHPWAWFTMPAEPGEPARKRFETRGQPIGGLPGAPKRPTLPGCNATVGERVAIIAGQDRAALRETWAGGGHPPVTAEQEATMRAELQADGITCEEDLPWGAVLGTVRLGCAIPMDVAIGEPGRDVLVIDGRELTEAMWGTWREAPDVPAGPLLRDRSDQEPYGVWAPGRWAVELDDPVRLMTPVPILGRQGLHHLRDTVPGTGCPRCEERMLTTSHEEEHDWCPSCGWVDE